MQTNIPAEITDIGWSGLNFRINGSEVSLHFSAGGWGHAVKYLLKLDGFYLVYEKDRDAMAFLRAVNENNRELLVLSKLTSIMWGQYSSPVLRSLLHGETDVIRVLKSVYLSLTHKEPGNARQWYFQVKELLPEAWNLFKDEDTRRYIARLMDFEANLIARGIKG